MTGHSLLHIHVVERAQVLKVKSGLELQLLLVVG